MLADRHREAVVEDRGGATRRKRSTTSPWTCAPAVPTSVRLNKG